MDFYYVRNRYGWGIEEYGDYISIISIVGLVGATVILPLLGYLQIRDTIIMPIITSGFVARHVIKAVVVHPWLLYLDNIIDLMGGYVFAAWRSLISKCVASHELGKIFALVASVDFVIPIVMQQLYALLWWSTGHLGDHWL